MRWDEMNPSPYDAKKLLAERRLRVPHLSTPLHFSNLLEILDMDRHMLTTDPSEFIYETHTTLD